MKFTVPLRFNHEFGRVYKRGRYIPGKHCVLHYMKNRREINRLGITTGRKVKGSVRRNRIRRLMREAYRLNEESVMCGYDIVLLGRDATEDLSYDIMESDIVAHLKKAGIWKPVGFAEKGNADDQEIISDADSLL